MTEPLFSILLAHVQAWITSSPWRTLTIVFALLNLKSLPMVWHLRIANAFLRALSIRPRPHQPLFARSIMTSRSPLLEIDYNLHKSNSTYFTDLDESRTTCATRVLSPGIGLVSEDLERQRPDPKFGKMTVILGSVFASFSRELPPYVKYEVQSRLLSWDQKWIYIVSYFVTRRGGGRGGRAGDGTGDVTVHASALSKYVCKKGRWTVPPEMLLRRSGVLPPPADDDYCYSNGPTTADGTVTAAEENSEDLLLPEERGLEEVANGAPVIETIDKLMTIPGGIPEGKETTTWTWSRQRIEQERLRGLKVVESFQALDSALAEEWLVHKEM